MLCYNKIQNTFQVTKEKITLFNINNTSNIYHGGGGLSTKKIAAARDPRLRSPPAAHARRQSSLPGAWARCSSSCWARCRARSWPCHLAVAGAGKSRQGLPQPSSHGSAIPRRSSHFGDRGASLLGCRLRVRRPAKVSKRRDAGQPRLR